MELEHIVERLAEQVERRFFGKHRGFVVDNADPEQLGRLKLTVPSVLGDQVVSGWAMPCVPYGGQAGQGFLCIPEVGAGVWVEFEEGDLEFPVWVGTFWSKPDGESELPKPNDAEGAEEDGVQDPPTRKIWKTVKGHTVQLEDADGEEKVMLVAAVDEEKRHVVRLHEGGIEIKDGANEHAVTFDDGGILISESNDGREIRLDGDGITIKDGPNKHQIVLDSNGVAVASEGDLNLTAKGDVNLSGANVNLSASSGDASLDATNVNLTAKGELTAKGSLIKLN